MEGTFEQRAGGRKEMSSAEIWRKCVPGGGNSRGEGPETGLCVECWRRRKGARVAGVTQGRRAGQECARRADHEGAGRL